MTSIFSEDIEELQNLLNLSRRPLVQKLLKDKIDDLEKSGAPPPSEESMEIDAEPLTLSPPPPKPVVVERHPIFPQISYSTLPSFAWDQDNERIKVYISLEGASSENIFSEFKKQSVDVKIHDLNGKNYRFGVPKLEKSIDPTESKVIVKPKRVIVSLKKSERGNWLDLNYKESKLKPKDKMDDKDPMGGIMDLMKNMYEEGDEDMKRTIAKAWTDARVGKKANTTSDF